MALFIEVIIIINIIIFTCSWRSSGRRTPPPSYTPHCCLPLCWNKGRLLLIHRDIIRLLEHLKKDGDVSQGIVTVNDHHVIHECPPSNSSQFPQNTKSKDNTKQSLWNDHLATGVTNTTMRRQERMTHLKIIMIMIMIWRELHTGRWQPHWLHWPSQLPPEENLRQILSS